MDEPEDIPIQFHAEPPEAFSEASILAKAGNIQNVEAEQMVLGGMLLYNDAYWDVAAILEGKHFYEGLHERIYHAIADRVKRGETASPVSLGPLFDTDPAMADVGGAGYLARMAAWATPVSVIGDYAKAVHLLWTRRQMIYFAANATARAIHWSPANSELELIEEVTRDFQTIATDSDPNERYVDIGDATQGALEELQEHAVAGGGTRGLMTGLSGVDEATGGLFGGDLMIIAGRPSMGKSCAGVTIARNVASQPDEDGMLRQGVAVYSFEMTAKQIAWRSVSNAAHKAPHSRGTPYFRIRRGDVNNEELADLWRAQREMADWPLRVFDGAKYTVERIQSSVRRYARYLMLNDKELKLVVIDFLQRIRPADTKQGRAQQVGDMINGLKDMAMELDLPVIVLSQLNRGVESRDNKRPTLSDLKESGGIEEAADIVGFTFRAEYYLQKELPEEGHPDYFEKLADLEAAKNYMDVFFDKVRMGATGRQRFHCRMAFDHIWDIAPEQETTL